MRVYFEALWQPEQLRESLRSDGWELEAQTPDSFVGVHPDVRDETAARCRLWWLGLLTCRSLRIEFLLSSSRPLPPPGLRPGERLVPAAAAPCRGET